MMHEQFRDGACKISGHKCNNVMTPLISFMNCTETGETEGTHHLYIIYSNSKQIIHSNRRRFKKYCCVHIDESKTFWCTTIVLFEIDKRISSSKIGGNYN